MEEIGHNAVSLVGRVSGEVVERELPSGDRLTTFRLVVPRSDGDEGRARVDTIDVACWSGRTRRVAGRVGEGTVVAVEGALRRRFFATGGARGSRYEVKAQRLRRLPGS
ncbi:single-strand DNA-binding protein [Georgenia satyanarayanai]|uniref:Single-strand DNA-binding protein n=1 Tax=Georgenia satyanarayanai TaxID=860221 RepID=A0A2Y9A0T0_9MICO|nr:single-stranded DNA-binding protein [Georgenia satyanarayanai]PYG02285.1 single-strand DNA-binding protein [Georgenia satyanarayanai]SSA37138.1 single-strand DNA-binding protein [Georgenia satyanarayanai]